MTEISLRHGAPPAAARRLDRDRARRLVRAEWTLLAGIVLVSGLARVYVALTTATATYFPDEYIYSQLARSIAHGSLTIRGAPAHFPALLDPLLAAPFWRLADPMVAYRLTLVMHGFAVSLAAIPAYLLARRLQATRWQCATVALITVAAPTMTWSGYVTADSIAYPLALGAIVLGVAALTAPRTRTQVGFLALAGLASFARVQYVILPVALVLAAFALERGHVPRTIKRFRVTFGLLALPFIGGLALGLHRVLGYYSSLTTFGFHPIALAHWIAIDSMLIAFATGFTLAPAAVVGLVSAMRRNALPEERAFAALSIAFGVLVLIETAAYATNGSPRFQERYLVTLMGLVPIGFILGMRAQSRLRWAVAGLAAVLFVCLARIPLTGYSVASGKQDSPFLSAVGYLEHLVGIGRGGLVVAIVGSALLGVGALAAFRPRAFMPAALVLAAVALAAASALATRDNLVSAHNAKLTYFKDQSLRWIDEAKLGPVDVLLGPSSFPPSTLEHLFWNASLTRLVNLRGSNLVDDFGNSFGRIAADGRILVNGVPMRRPVLADDYYTSFTFQGGRRLRSTPTAALYTTGGVVRLSTMTVGRYFDGWLDRTAVVTIWPQKDGASTGVLRFRLTFPVTKNVTAIVRVRTHGAPVRTFRVPANASVPVAIPLKVTHPVQVEISGKQPFVYGRRIVSVTSTVPRFTR